MFSLQNYRRTRSRSPTGDRFWRFSAGTTLLFLVVLTYIVVFSTFSILTYQNFGMSAFDIGIHDQAIWKIATGRGLFSTVRGLPIWGDHCWFIMIFLAPLYWIWPSLKIILVLQSVALAIGAVPLAAYTYRLTQSRSLAVVLSICWLLSPALQNMNLENFHPEVIAAPFLLWAVERADAKSWQWYGIAVFIAILCKEDVALTVIALGIWVFFAHDRRIGILTIIAGLAWFAFCMKLVLPYFNDEGFFRFQGGYWFSSFWNNKFSFQYYLDVLTREQVHIYLWQLGLPVLFLGLFSPLLMFVAIPSLVINILSGNDYLVSVHYHYNFQTLPFIFVATASTLAWIGKRDFFGREVMLLTLGVLVAATVYANNKWSQLPLKNTYPQLQAQLNSVRNSGVDSRFRELVTYLPTDPEIPISVSHNLLPHLAHRTEVYMYPNPFYPVYWGINGENLPSPERIMWIVIDTNALDKSSRGLLRRLLHTGEFILVHQSKNLLVAKRDADKEPSPITDPINAEADEKAIQVFAFVSNEQVTSLDPLPIRSPDIQLITHSMNIPLTDNRLQINEGLDLGAADNIQVVLNGKWKARGKEDMIIRIRADDGCKLYLDGKELVDYNGVHSYEGEVHTQRMRLSPGWHQIAVHYFEWGGLAGIKVEWASAKDENFKILSVGDLLP